MRDGFAEFLSSKMAALLFAVGILAAFFSVYDFQSKMMEEDYANRVCKNIVREAEVVYSSPYPITGNLSINEKVQIQTKGSSVTVIHKSINFTCRSMAAFHSVTLASPEHIRIYMDGTSIRLEEV